MTPALSILDRRFTYRHSTHTDVRDTWRRHGFIGPEAARQAERHREQHEAALQAVAAYAPRRAPAITQDTGWDAGAEDWLRRLTK